MNILNRARLVCCWSLSLLLLAALLSMGLACPASIFYWVVAATLIVLAVLGKRSFRVFALLCFLAAVYLTTFGHRPFCDPIRIRLPFESSSKKSYSCPQIITTKLEALKCQATRPGNYEAASEIHRRVCHSGILESGCMTAAFFEVERGKIPAARKIAEYSCRDRSDVLGCEVLSLIEEHQEDFAASLNPHETYCQRPGSGGYCALIGAKLELQGDGKMAKKYYDLACSDGVKLGCLLPGNSNEEKERLGWLAVQEWKETCAKRSTAIMPSPLLALSCRRFGYALDLLGNVDGARELYDLACKWDNNLNCSGRSGDPRKE